MQSWFGGLRRELLRADWGGWLRTGSVCKRTATLSFSLRRQTWHAIIPNVPSSCWSTLFVQNSCHSVALSGDEIIMVRTVVVVQLPNSIRIVAAPWTAVLPVPHHLPEFAQVHVQGVTDAVQPSHPPSPSFPPAFNLSQYQVLFQWVGRSHQVVGIFIANNFTNFSILTFTNHKSSVTHLTTTETLQNGCSCHSGAVLEFGVCHTIKV